MVVFFWSVFRVVFFSATKKNKGKNNWNYLGFLEWSFKIRAFRKKKFTAKEQQRFDSTQTTFFREKKPDSLFFETKGEEPYDDDDGVLLSPIYTKRVNSFKMTLLLLIVARVFSKFFSFREKVQKNFRKGKKRQKKC